MKPFFPVHIEQFLNTEESRILTIARLPSNKSVKSITNQLAAYEYADDIKDIHDLAARKFNATTDQKFKGEIHLRHSAQAQQLKLLALNTLHELTH